MCDVRIFTRVAWLACARRPVVDFPPGFLELNAPRQRPPLLGNPIFGYSTHPMPPPVLGEEPPTRAAKFLTKD